MPVTARRVLTAKRMTLPSDKLRLNPFSLLIYGDPKAEIDDLLPSIRDQGILVALVVAPGPDSGTWDVISGHRRLACAQTLGITEIPCEVRHLPDETDRRRLVLEYNRQRRKTFSQLMREADALEELWKPEASARRVSNLRRGQSSMITLSDSADRRNSDDRAKLEESDARVDKYASAVPESRGRTDTAIAQLLEIGGKDLYRQARTIWRLAQSGDIRAKNALAQLDARTKTVHAAYKDLRRRTRFSADFRPTPYDVWPFRHDRAFGIPHPGTIPPAIVAHTLHYFTHPGALVVDPMAGGGTTVDVCESLGRRCLAYDLVPTRPDIQHHDICNGFPPETLNCDLIFCDPPYHTMLARSYVPDSVSRFPFTQWIAFLHQLTRQAFQTLRPGGYLALLLATQTEKDLPAGFGYLDHAFYGYSSALRAGFLPERRISCPMDGGYLPQHVSQARREGRLLGQVRDLLVLRKPLHPRQENNDLIYFTQAAAGADLQELRQT
jgi:ParB family transcriptional regulator, chromosome partitioning protein